MLSSEVSFATAYVIEPERRSLASGISSLAVDAALMGWRQPALEGMLIARGARITQTPVAGLPSEDVLLLAIQRYFAKRSILDENIEPDDIERNTEHSQEHDALFANVESGLAFGMFD